MFKLLCIALLAGLTIQPIQTEFQVLYEWNLMDYEWELPEAKNRAIKTGEYIPENNILTGLEIDDDKIFVTIPRGRSGVPATLSYFDKTTQTKSPKLKPFPSWQMNRYNNCAGLQNVQNIRIDLRGIMWIIDAGQTATTNGTNFKCPPKLLLLNLKENNRIVHSYTFPNEVALHDGNGLNDLVIDQNNGYFAYITDTGPKDPGLIVYSMAGNDSWKVRDNASMLIEPKAINITINGTTVESHTPIDGIALTPLNTSRSVIYCPLTGFHMYSIPTEVIQNKSLATGVVSSHIQCLGSKTSQTGGMIADANGVMYYGLFNSTSVEYWNISNSLKSQKLFAEDPDTLQWPDSFAIDTKGYLYLTSNRQQRAIAGQINGTEINFRILAAFINSNSSLY